MKNISQYCFIVKTLITYNISGKQIINSLKAMYLSQ